MKKIVKLTESDLTRLIKKIIKEEELRNSEGDLIFQRNDKFVLLRDLTQRRVQRYLSQLPQTIRHLSIIDCDGVDFSEIDICSFPDLSTVNLKGTKNNFKEVVDCEFEELSNGVFHFERPNPEGGFFDRIINNMNMNQD